ncbi:MAG: 4-(cytidine 5'-diphospho)-2-C-methyl-D-erythritol kinase [Verrucomicrobiales bacterium]|nr:4-(cytidine 5'-diphospho)-2-C-methyl-D-erythritol kinase [Verrucomicrobiales bacterium]
MTVHHQSHCKINLLLNILRKREDGFHELETVMAPVACFDELEFSKSHAGIRIIGNHPELNDDPQNLIRRAAQAFFAETRIEPEVHIRHEKRLPMAAGLGGGSSNAAHTLRGLNELFDEPLASDDLHRLAAQLGSDINFFLQDGPAMATGRGEQVESLEPFPALKDAGLLLIKPGFGVSTPWAFKNLARYPKALEGTPGRAKLLVELLNGSDVGSATAEFYNSLEASVLPKHPLLKIYQDFLNEHGAIVSLMSGSGSTTFAVTGSEVDAKELGQAFVARFGNHCWTSATRLQG